MNDGFRPANRQSAKPLIGIYAESGCGKTLSALLLARGFVGPAGRIGMIETESGRGEAYSDPKEYPDLAGPGTTNYDVLSLRDEFSPKAYGAAIKKAEAARLDALIIDSASHEWEGPGGVLSMAAANQDAGKKGVQVWQKPKIDHSREFMLPVLQTPIPLVILCMRAKYPMEQKKGGGSGDDKWVRSTVLEPKQSEDMLFEMFAHGWIDQEHNFHLTKPGTKSLMAILSEIKPLSIATGQALAAWAKNSGPAATQQPSKEAALDLAKKELREAAEGGMAPLTAAWERLTAAQRKFLQPFYDQDLEPAAVSADHESEGQ